MDFNRKLEGAKVARNVNIMLSMMHCVLFIFFLFIHAYMLVMVSLVTITIYVNLFSVIKMGKLVIYIRTVYLEIWFLMMLTTILVGWECGFQLYCFPLVPTIFYSYYISDNGSNKKIQPILISIVSAIVYLFVRLYTYYNGSLYKPSNELITLIISFVNVMIVFGFLIFFMLNYTKSVMHIEDSLRNMADFDELTKLYNRHKMKAILSQANLDEKENRGYYFITIVDIDGFKSINDKYGHNAGDYVLGKVADILKKNSSNMELCRWGGEEFLILLKCKDDLSECYEKIDNIRNVISNTKFIYNKKRINVTITAGIAKFGNDMTVEEVINMADEYLYKGKNTGKNCVITI